MEINIWILLSMLAIHWFADFVCQSSWQAENKSKEWLALLMHTITYSLIWIIPLVVYDIHSGGAHRMLFWFLPITFVCHTATDYYTSRVNSLLWEKKEVHTFFASIGFDQFLHTIQLVLTFYYLSKS